jgi:ankyrin repeat protein
MINSYLPFLESQGKLLEPQVAAKATLPEEAAASIALPLLTEKKPEIDGFVAFAQLKKFFRIRAKKLEKEDTLKFESLLDQLGDINSPRDNLGDNPLIFLAKLGSPIECVEILRRRGADFNYQEHYFGNTALLWAIANANNGMAREIILRGNQNLNLQDTDRGKNTPLILAIGKGYTTHDANGNELTLSNFELVKTLLQHGADPNVVNGKGVSPLEMAVIRRSPEMVEALLAAGARIDFDWEETLNLSYEEASKEIANQVFVYLLDEGSFESSKDKVAALLSSKA